MHWKHDIWKVPGRPTLSLVFRNQDDNEYDHWHQMYNMEPRLVRQREWMSDEMMKPPKPQSAATNELPDIYGIGIREPIFEDNWKTIWQRLEEYEQVLARIIDNVEQGRECSDSIPQAGPPLHRSMYTYGLSPPGYE